MVSIGDLLVKEAVKRTSVGQEIDYYIKNNLYVPDHITTDVLAKYLHTLEDNSQCFIEGFPKTVYQAKYLVSQGVIPDAMVFINSDEHSDKAVLKAKFEGNGVEYTGEVNFNDDANSYYDLYKFHIAQCKAVFQAISLEFDNREANTVDKLARLVTYRLKKGFDSPLKFIILGKASDNKRLVLQKFNECFGVKPVVIDQLVKAEVDSKSELAQKLLYYLERNKDVPNGLIFELVTKRLQMTDAEINGFALDLTGRSPELIEQIFNKKLGVNFTLMIEDDDMSPEYYRRLIGLTEGSYRYIVSNSTSDVGNLVNRIIFEIVHIKDK